MAATSICSSDVAVRVRSVSINPLLDRLLRKTKMKRLEIRIPIKPVSKMYKHGTRGMYRHHLTVKFEKDVSVCVANQINRYRWKSTSGLKIEFEFYFATPRRYRWGQLKTTKPDIDNLIKSTMDGFSDMIGDDAKVAEIEAKKFWAKENLTVIVLINQPT